MSAFSRRRFVFASSGLLLAGATGQAARHYLAAKLPITELSRAALGTTVTIQVVHADTAIATSALEAAFAEIELVEQTLSIYRPDSQLSRLNRKGVLADPHPYLLTVLRHAEATSRSTSGAFDITVQPLWSLYASAQQQDRLPTAAEIQQARQLVDWRNVQIKASVVQLRGEGTTITLNGIAQGFAADRAMQALRKFGVEHALVNAGELASHGATPAGELWQIGIQHPRQANAYAELAQLGDRCLATSGDYETKFSPDNRHNHLFDPRTGYSPTELASVSIAAPTAMAADALSTACFVLGPDKASALIASLPKVDALLIRKDGRQLVTANFPLV